MQEEIQNNRSDGRNRMDDLEALPREASWDKLYSRLEKKKRSNKPVWWYLAAACVGGIIFLFSLFYSDNNAIKEISKTEKPLKIVLSQPGDVVKSKPFIQKKNSLPIIHKKLTVPPKEEIEAPIAINFPDTIASVQHEMTVIAPKKKLRVVHINDLEPPGDEVKQDWAQNGNTKSKRAKNKNLIHSYVSNSTSDKVLKINLSPSN